MKKVEPVPWSLRDVFRMCMGLVFIYLCINLAGHLVFKLNPGSKPFINITGGIGMYGLGIWFIIYNSGLRPLGIRWYRWLTGSLKAILFYAGFIPILGFLAYLGLLLCYYLGIRPEPHPLVEILKKERPGFFTYYLVITAVVIAPVFEEMLFRGLFYQTFKKRFGYLRAAVISSGLFSLLHFNAAQFLPVMGLGALLCFIFEYTGSLVPVIVLHMFNNGLFLGLFFIFKEHI